MHATDPWARWIIETRFAGDGEAAKEGMRWLYGVRDKVLDHAALREGETLLDVGAGDGLIGFGALDRVGTAGKVIFSDISQSLIEHTEALAEQLGVQERCMFVCTSAEDLRFFTGEAVDVVTTRSVLIYVADKSRALREFHRVLKQGGRISLFEPINRVTIAQPETRLWWQGYDVTPVLPLARRIREFDQQSAGAQTPMIDFDERDLLAYCEAAGFADIHLELHVDIQQPAPQKWETMINTPPNPLAPSLAEVMTQVLSAEEAQQFEAHLRPLVERGQGKQRAAGAYLWATKG